MGELVVHMRWHHRVHPPRDQAIAFQLSESLGEHLLAHFADLFLQARKAFWCTIFQRFDDEQCPLVSNAGQQFAG